MHMACVIHMSCVVLSGLGDNRVQVCEGGGHPPACAHPRHLRPARPDGDAREAAFGSDGEGGVGGHSVQIPGQ